MALGLIGMAAVRKHIYQVVVDTYIPKKIATNHENKDKQTKEKELNLIIEEQQKTIKEILQRLDKVETLLKINKQDNHNNQERNYAKVTSENIMYKPAPKVDSGGEDTETNKEPKQYDYTPVTTSRKFFKPRPEMYESQFNQIEIYLQKHIEEKRSNPLHPKKKPKQNMSNQIIRVQKHITTRGNLSNKEQFKV